MPVNSALVQDLLVSAKSIVGSLAIQDWRKGGMKLCRGRGFLVLFLRLMKGMHDSCLAWEEHARLVAQNLIPPHRMRGLLMGFPGNKDEESPLLRFEMRCDCVNSYCSACTGVSG
jgi:hypothetical protein